ncbi:MFS transporter [Leptothermofonsia sichuanensis E412]|uniref:MFS transporter n=1 Tax=Leptothermofonsia sichuanensis TaxID=2917832 RepID=UPI001CA72795|nr:MFS transporter [Leptothermofonsia sichuanensis]QZZ18694.1 MFS transporter [Leptothermofonsia sichuanensis E412]
MSFRSSKLFSWVPRLNYQVWILALGRLLSQTGSGFTLFAAPIFFVNQVGLSATQVGLAIGSSAISGIGGRLLGGSCADSRTWGRRRTLMLAAIVSAAASFVLAVANDFLMLVLGNLLVGLGLGLYWPPNEAMVADLSPPEQRNESFAITRLCDSLGLGLGVILGGRLIGITGAYRMLFVIDGISFLVLLGIVYWAIAESGQFTETHQALRGWQTALRDRHLLTYIIPNVMFTTYLVQVSSTLPLYLNNFIPGQSPARGFSPEIISNLFAWHLVATVLSQMPTVRFLNRFSHPQGLIISANLWSIGFVLVWLTGVAPTGHLLWAILATGVLAIATSAYMPSAASTTVELAPEALRGVYLAVNSQCWALGYMIGPPLGGWALDQSKPVVHGYWLAMAASVIVAILILQALDRMMHKNRRMKDI